MTNTNPSPSTDLAWAEARESAADRYSDLEYCSAKNEYAINDFKRGADFGREYQRAYEAKRAEGLIATLEQMAAHKDEGNAEGYFGTLASEALSTYRNGEGAK